MADEVLLCCDLDRTVVPNGEQPESPRARPLLRALAARPELVITYVSGRDAGLIRGATAEYALPLPDYAVGDVGTTIYRVDGDEWRAWDGWADEIRPDWAGYTNERLAALLEDLTALRPQEPAKQGRFKLSYYAPADIDHDALIAEMERRLEDHGVRANLTWSVDETVPQGLIDVLPASASKLHAIRFLRERLRIAHERTVFAGDSGNDLPVLTSDIQSVLVANATDEVRETARAQSEVNGTADALYLATGDALGMNGNYSAGVIEGLLHYVPDTRAWLDQ